MTEKVRVAFIGAGVLANSIHYPCLASLPDVDIVAACDLVEDKARETAERFGIPRTFTNHEEMLEEGDPQVAYVIMPPQNLFEPAAAVLSQGRHLFVEKPLGMTVKQARMMAYLAQENSCLTAVGFQRRHIPAMTELKRRAEEQGPIHQATVSFLKGGSNRPLDQPAAVYGGAIDSLTVDGIHAVDNLRFASPASPSLERASCCVLSAKSRRGSWIPSRGETSYSQSSEGSWREPTASCLPRASRYGPGRTVSRASIPTSPPTSTRTGVESGYADESTAQSKRLRCSSMPSSRVDQARRAHFTRTGASLTPARASRGLPTAAAA